MNQFFCSIDWSKVINHTLDINALYANFLQVVHTAIRLYVPRSKKCTKPLLPASLKKLLNKKKKMYSDVKNNLATMEEYKNIEKAYKQAVSKNNCEREGKIASSCNKNLLYKYVNSKFKNKGSIPALQNENHQIIIEPSQKANLLNKTFQEVYTTDDGKLPPLPNHNDYITPMEWIYISQRDVEFSLNKLKRSVSRTPDEIPAIILKMCSSNLSYPLTQLFNISLSKRTLPKLWKEAIIVPIHKKGIKSCPKNYRPISMTSAVCRAMETVLQRIIIHHLISNNLLNKNQYGFLPRRNTLSLHLNLLDELTKLRDKKINTEMLYLDFSKAFDRVSHQKLLHSLSQFKLDPKILNWLTDYLDGRSQRTIIQNTLSNYSRITSGVPQGSVLGPTLFLVYINSLLDKLEQKFPAIKFYAFADDLKLLGNDGDELQLALKYIELWNKDWQLQIQATKSEHISFTKDKQDSIINNTTLNFTINNQEFSRTNIVKDLGLFISYNLNWTTYIEKIQFKSSHLSYLILRSFQSTNPNLYIFLYKTYIRPLLEYNSAIWSPFLVKDLILAENTQKSFTRNLCKKLNLKYLNYIDRLKILNLESLELRRVKSDLILVYKIMNNLIDINNSKLFTLNNIHSKYSLRRNSLYLIKSKASQTRIRENFFCNRIITTWNQLPNFIVTSPNLTNFKKNIDNFPLHTIYNFYYK